MNIVVNGQPQTVPEPMAVAQLIDYLNYGSPRMAVAVNLEFVPRSAYGDTWLHEADRVEIVAAISGG